MIHLSVKHLSKSYGSTQALYDFCADFTPGIYALLGPNGSGKSTLMNLITDNLKADTGEIFFQVDEGEPQNTLKMGASFREKLGFMPQYSEMTPHFSVETFLWYMATLKGVGDGQKKKEKKSFITSEIDQVLQAVELDDVRESKIKALSGGMKQRLSLAQAMLGNPDILILDEPTAGLDPKQRVVIRNLISQLAAQKIVLIATHIVSDIEAIANKVIFLKKGVISDFGSPSDLLKKMEGKVWNLSIATDEVERIKEEFSVINILNDEENGKVILRILSSLSPRPDAKPVSPSLEDLYLSIFGEEEEKEKI